MKRRLLKLGLFLLLLASGGAIINVAVAWGMVFTLGPVESDHSRFASGHNQKLPEYGDWLFTLRTSTAGQQIKSIWRRPPFGAMPWQAGDPESVIPRWANFARPDLNSPERSSRRIDAEARGWPSLALMSIHTEYRCPPVTKDSAVWRVQKSDWGIPSGRFSASADPRILPVVPLWPGFAINTIFYASILWLLFAAPGFVRRRIRIWRGLCAACGYDLRGHTSGAGICPECRRRIIKLCAFILAGAIVNVAVTWSIEFLGQWRDYQSPPFVITGAITFGGKFAVDRIILGELSLQELTGFPCAGLACERVPLGDLLFRVQAYEHGGLCVRFDSGGKLVAILLPCKPVWPGFAINTVFYAAVLWVLLALPGAVRRFVRRKRGRCTRCGYDLRGQVADRDRKRQCPECGIVNSLSLAGRGLG
jgi:predicted RNA-binding Zn-ribbon protein involved in translation (DUF1610 family)